MRKIELGRGKQALIDEKDYWFVSLFKWHIHDTNRIIYASAGIQINDKLINIYMHRLISNAPKGKQVDHINHNGLDNRKSNLRICTQTQNTMNCRPHRGSSSKYKGVTWVKQSNKWKAAISVNNKNIFIGEFEDETDAARAYNSVALKHQGKFAYLNKL